MATFNVEIDIDNSAFEDSGELSRLLRTLADKVLVQSIEGEVTHNSGSYVVTDSNGNRVGSAWIEDGSGWDVESDR